MATTCLGRKASLDSNPLTEAVASQSVCCQQQYSLQSSKGHGIIFTPPSSVTVEAEKTVVSGAL